MGIFENTVLVNKKVSAMNIVARAVCIGLFAVCIVFSMWPFPGMLIPVAFLIAGLWYLLRYNAAVEYEYTYIEGRLTVARIKSKRRRKTLAQIEMEEVILIAPSTAPELYKYQKDNSVRTKNCSSGFSGRRTYEVIYKKTDGQCRLIFEPDDEMLDKISVRYGKLVVR